MKLNKFFIVCWMLLPLASFGQLYNPTTVYRPMALNWQELKTTHFRIIFPDGADSLAYRSAAILEAEYAGASKLTGGTLENFPVILNTYNDLSNGFVSSFNFRSEIDLAPLKGKGMNPQSGDWLETVLPHELVHATHFNVQQPYKEKKFSLSNIISVLSPDVARMIHGFPPVGLHEGLAVYYETNAVTPTGGRGNYTYSTNRFNANFGTPHRWSMGQTLVSSDYSLPYNRHYIAGYSFVNWLENTFGEDFARESIRYHYNMFFLGYGFTLRHKTGRWPNTLYRMYERDLAQEEEVRLATIPQNTTENSKIIDLPFKGEEVHRPLWINEHTLLFYGSFYNSKVGFYRYNLESGKVDLVKEIFSVGDYNYELDKGQTLYFGNYNRHPRYTGTYTTDIQKLNVATGKMQPLTHNARAFAPTTNGKRLLGIQTKGAGGQIIEVLENGDIEVLKTFTHAVPIALKFSPENPQKLAVIVRKRSVQALWFANVSSLASDLEKEPALAFSEASIFDVEWHPSGKKLLFTLDKYPAMNVYEYDIERKKVIQITGSLYNAFEASYSPSGDKIAYILQSGDERKVALLNRADFLNKEPAAYERLTNEEAQAAFQRPLLGASAMDSIQAFKKEPYRGDISWLRPRTLYPVVKDNAGVNQIGVGFASVDALSRQAYDIEFTGIQNRLWYNFSYTNKMFYPGFELEAFNNPSFFTIKNPNTNQNYSLMQQKRGASISLPFEHILKGDTRYSSFYLEPEFTAEQYKYYSLRNIELSDFATRYKAGVFSQLSVGMLNLPRDVQPSSGMFLFGSFDQALNAPSYSLKLPKGPAFTLGIKNQWAAYYGLSGFVSPLRRWNQSLRVDVRFLQQSDNPIYSTNTIIPLGFSDDPFPDFDAQGNALNTNLGRLSTRYTIPLFYPDNGMLTVPLYLSSIYLSTFTHTLTNMNANDLMASSRTILGAGFHVQFKVSNLLFDLGVGLSYEPTRNKTQFIIGQF
jgi:hypothetical protein